jgi:DNA-binding transcriptional regulator YhcF (GntR family)
MKVTLNLNSPVPVYRQVVDQIRHYLVSGELKPGDKLPSVRRLAIDLGVHHNTIAEAYRTLAAEGWMDVSHGRAVQVVERAAGSSGRREREDFSRRLRNLIAEMRAKGLSESWIESELRNLISKEAK